MTKIVGIIRPNAYKQSFHVYKDGNKVEEFEIFLEDFDTVINNYITKFDVTQVDLIGPKQYVRGLTKGVSNTNPNTQFNLL